MKVNKHTSILLYICTYAYISNCIYVQVLKTVCVCVVAPAKLLAIIYAFRFPCREVQGYTSAITQIKIYNAVGVRSPRASARHNK